MDERSETPQTQQLTSYDNTRNEKRMSMDDWSETPDTATYMLWEYKEWKESEY